MRVGRVRGATVQRGARACSRVFSIPYMYSICQSAVSRLSLPELVPASRSRTAADAGGGGPTHRGPVQWPRGRGRGRRSASFQLRRSPCLSPDQPGLCPQVPTSVRSRGSDPPRKDPSSCERAKGRLQLYRMLVLLLATWGVNLLPAALGGGGSLRLARWRVARRLWLCAPWGGLFRAETQTVKLETADTAVQSRMGVKNFPC